MKGSTLSICLGLVVGTDGYRITLVFIRGDGDGAAVAVRGSVLVSKEEKEMNSCNDFRSHVPENKSDT